MFEELDALNGSSWVMIDGDGVTHLTFRLAPSRSPGSGLKPP